MTRGLSIGVSGRTVLSRACDQLDRDDGAFCTALALLLLVAGLVGHLERRWSR